MLSRLLGTFMAKRGQFYTHRTNGAQLVRQWMYWGEDELARSLRDGNHGLVDSASTTWLLILDDIGFSADRTGFITNALGEILNRRAGKWTFLTSNLFVEEWAKRDPRIASRMLRDGNRVVRFDCRDFALRQIRKAA